MISETKVCTKCEVEKMLAEFSKHKLGKYGVSSICKVCNRISSRSAYVMKNPNAKKYKVEGNAKTKAQRQKEYINRHPLSHENLREKWRRSRKNLSAHYVKSLIGIADCPPELVELKREQIRIRRLAKQLKEEIKNV